MQGLKGFACHGFLDAGANDGFASCRNQPAVAAGKARGYPDIDGILRCMQRNTVTNGVHLLEDRQPEQAGDGRGMAIGGHQRAELHRAHASAPAQRRLAVVGIEAGQRRVKKQFCAGGAGKIDQRAIEGISVHDAARQQAVGAGAVAQMIAGTDDFLDDDMIGMSIQAERDGNELRAICSAPRGLPPLDGEHASARLGRSRCSRSAGRAQPDNQHITLVRIRHNLAFAEVPAS